METAEAGSIPARQFGANQVQTIGAEATLHVTIETQTPTERTCMNIKTKIKMTMKKVVSTVVILSAITCIGVSCGLVTPSA
jgi:hypothetical protein